MRIRGTGVKGDGEEGVWGGGGGGRGGRVREILGTGVIPVCCILVILLYFYVLQCKHSVPEVSNDILR